MMLSRTLIGRLLDQAGSKYVLVASAPMPLCHQYRYRHKKTDKDNGGEFGKWLMLVFPIGGFALGTWQVRRKQWKLELIRKLEEKTSAEPIPFPTDLNDLKHLEYRPLVVHGAFDHSREIHVGPRSLICKHETKAVDAGSLMSTKSKNIGVQVITPFYMPDRDLTILVNRGFVPREKEDPRSRMDGQVDGLTELTGILRHNEKRPPLVPKNKPQMGMWNYKDLDEMGNLTGASPILLDAVSTIPNGPIGGQTKVSLRDEHLSYAVTWYSLSVATFAMWYMRFIR